MAVAVDSNEELEQYGRRLCLRVEGCESIPNELSEDVLNNVIGYSDSVDAGIPEHVFDRAHRIGKEYVDKTDNKTKRSIILRMTTFRHRTKLYYQRKAIQDRFGVAIRLDLTGQRHNTLKQARELVKGMADVNYVYADINCRLKVKFVDGRDLFFKDLDKLKSILNL